MPRRSGLALLIAIVAFLGGVSNVMARECKQHEGWGFGLVKELAVDRSKFWMNNNINHWSGGGKVRVRKTKTNCTRNVDLYFACKSQAKACK